MADEVQVQIRFSAEHEGKTFTDALYFTPEAFAALKPGELDAMKQARVDTWIALFTPRPAPTKEELEAHAASIEEQIAGLQEQKAEVETRAALVASLVPEG